MKITINGWTYEYSDLWHWGWQAENIDGNVFEQGRTFEECYARVEELLAKVTP